MAFSTFAEISVLGAENDAVGRVLMEQVHQLVDGRLVQVELGQNLDAVAGRRRQMLVQAGGILGRSHQDQVVSATAPWATLLSTQRRTSSSLSMTRPKLMRAEQNDDGAGQLLVEQEPEDDHRPGRSGRRTGPAARPSGVARRSGVGCKSRASPAATG